MCATCSRVAPRAATGPQATDVPSILCQTCQPATSAIPTWKPMLTTKCVEERWEWAHLRPSNTQAGLNIGHQAHCQARLPTLQICIALLRAKSVHSRRWEGIRLVREDQFQCTRLRHGPSRQECASFHLTFKGIAGVSSPQRWTGCRQDARDRYERRYAQSERGRRARR